MRKRLTHLALINALRRMSSRLSLSRTFSEASERAEEVEVGRDWLTWRIHLATTVGVDSVRQEAEPPLVASQE